MQLGVDDNLIKSRDLTRDVGGCQGLKSSRTGRRQGGMTIQ